MSDNEEQSPMLQPRYAEIATFMRAPLAESLDEVDIALVGVPTDLGVTNRARFAMIFNLFKKHVKLFFIKLKLIS